MESIHAVELQKIHDQIEQQRDLHELQMHHLKELHELRREHLLNGVTDNNVDEYQSDLVNNVDIV